MDWSIRVSRALKFTFSIEEEVGEQVLCPIFHVQVGESVLFILSCNEGIKCIPGDRIGWTALTSGFDC